MHIMWRHLRSFSHSTVDRPPLGNGARTVHREPPDCAGGTLNTPDRDTHAVRPSKTL